MTLFLLGGYFLSPQKNNNLQELKIQKELPLFCPPSFFFSFVLVSNPKKKFFFFSSLIIFRTFFCPKKKKKNFPTIYIEFNGQIKKKSKKIILCPHLECKRRRVSPDSQKKKQMNGHLFFLVKTTKLKLNNKKSYTSGRHQANVDYELKRAELDMGSQVNFPVFCFFVFVSGTLFFFVENVTTRRWITFSREELLYIYKSIFAMCCNTLKKY